MTSTLRSRRWVFTLNNWLPEHESILKTIPSKYLIYGKETGESGTPHLQGFIILPKVNRLSALKKLLPTAHWEIAKGTSLQASTYCKKDGDFFESGIPPSPGQRSDLLTVCDMVKEGFPIQDIASQHPDTFVKFGRGIIHLKLILDTKHTPEGLRGLWYWGPPGTGKSRKARDDNPDAYLKGQHKWFDGYNGEDVIILDDMDTEVLGHYLKIWADRYPCTGETKGGTINLQHEKFIVTSNYSIEYLWRHDEDMQKAILRRFTVVNFDRLPPSEPIDYVL